MPTFRARFDGTCAACGKPILAQAHYISWSRKQRNSTRHRDCLAPTAPGSDGGFDGQGDDGSGNGGQLPQEKPQGATPQSGEGQGGAPSPPGVSEARVRAIAGLLDNQVKIEVARDAESLKADLAAYVEAKLAESIPQSITIKREEKDGIKEHKIDLAHKELKRLLYLVRKGFHVYAWGPPGSGKSAGASQVAEALGCEYGYMSLNPWTPESRLLGHPDLSLDGKGRYVETLFIRLYEHGGVFCIDEMDNASPALLNVLNSALESDAHGNGFLALPHRMVKRSAKFVMIAAGNTNGRGGDTFFPERRQFDAAFSSRFRFLAWDYDLALEKTLVLRKNAKAGDILKWGRDVRGFCKTQGIRLVVGPREIIGVADMACDGAEVGLDMAKITEAAVFKGIDQDTVKRILDAHPLPAMETARHPQARNSAW